MWAAALVAAAQRLARHDVAPQMRRLMQRFRDTARTLGKPEPVPQTFRLQPIFGATEAEVYAAREPQRLD